MPTEVVPLTVTLHGAAALLGMTYDTLQRSWRAMVDQDGFPSPYIGSGVGQRPRWLREFVVRWMEARSAGGALPDFDAAQPDRAGTGAPGVGKSTFHPMLRELLTDDQDEVAALLSAAGGR